MAPSNEITEQLNEFKQELIFVLRATHCLVEDTESLDTDIIMGMLHTERRLISTLNEIIEKVESS